MSEKPTPADPPAPVIRDIWANLTTEEEQSAVADTLIDDVLPSGVIGYANPWSGRRPMSRDTALWVLGLSIVPAVVGLTTLLLIWLTAEEPVVIFALLWLLIGGVMTAGFGIAAITGASRATLRYPSDPVATLYGWAIVANVVNVIAAIICIKIGADLSESPHSHILATNRTSVMIDELTVHFSSGDVSFYKLAPGAGATSGMKWLTHSGPLEITTKVGGSSRTKVDRITSALNLKTDPYTITVEPNELPPQPGKPATP